MLAGFGGRRGMARPLSNDLRERVVAAVDGGESCRSVAVRFEVAVSSVVKWSQRRRRTGSVAPGKMGGHRKPVLEPHRAFIVERIERGTHLTLHGYFAIKRYVVRTRSTPARRFEHCPPPFPRASIPCARQGSSRVSPGAPCEPRACRASVASPPVTA